MLEKKIVCLVRMRQKKRIILHRPEYPTASLEYYDGYVQRFWNRAKSKTY